MFSAALIKPGLKVLGVIGIALGVFAATFWLGSQLRSVGTLTEQVAQMAASNSVLTKSNDALRVEIEDLARDETRRSQTHKLVLNEIGTLREAAKEVKHACDQEPLLDAYVNQLRRAAGIAATATGLPKSTGELDGSDDPAGEQP